MQFEGLRAVRDMEKQISMPKVLQELFEALLNFSRKST